MKDIKSTMIISCPANISFWTSHASSKDLQSDVSAFIGLPGSMDSFSRNNALMSDLYRAGRDRL
jgi:hypothetical protein